MGPRGPGAARAASYVAAFGAGLAIQRAFIIMPIRCSASSASLANWWRSECV
jgi:hypothetical protein